MNGEADRGVDAVERSGEIVSRMRESFGATVVGQEALLRSLLLGVFGDGHVLVESVPGLAKTTAAKALAACFAADFARVQCTPDLLPSDIVGTEVYDHATSSFTTRLGPVHTNFLLIDEINRASAKTQSALLEAMQERQTTVGGALHQLPDPFLVVATQNPIEHEGTYLLPEAQLDRFLVKAVLTYPTAAEEAEVLRRATHDSAQVAQVPVASLDELRLVRDTARDVHVSVELRDYVVRLVRATRAIDRVDPALAGYVELGASPRGALALQACARVVALLAGRDHVLPEDIKSVRHEALRHRVALTFDALADDVDVDVLIDAVFDAVPVP